MQPRAPNETDRVIIIGRTGSGKSQFAVSLLATRDYLKRPWYILDYKGEDLIEDIMDAVEGGIKRISVNDPPPSKAGLYYVKVRPLIDDDAIETFLRLIYERASGKNRLGSGIFLDEGFALPRNSKFFDILLTQGRTLKCPIICLYQRPNMMSRFAVSQSTFRALFDLEDHREREIAARFIRPTGDKTTPKAQLFDAFSHLPEYHCLWYDVGKGISTVLSPAPDRQSLINAFVKRLRPRKRRVLI